MAKSFISGAVKSDSVVCDFTMGNGHDTEYLCSMVPDGKVYAFDIQKSAVENTRKRLAEAGYSNAVLIHGSHAECKEYVKEPIAAGMFNLGWLPGGDKSVHTLRPSTEKAVNGAIDLLAPAGNLVISVYPGHPEGRAEGEMLLEMLSKLDKKLYCVVHFHIVNSPDAPFIISVEKYDK